MATQPSIISDRPYSVAQDDSKRGTFALYCGGVYVCGCRTRAEVEAMANDCNAKHEAIAKRKRLEAAAPELLSCLVSAMSFIPNPDEPEDSRADKLTEYDRLWCREMHKHAREAFVKAGRIE